MLSTDKSWIGTSTGRKFYPLAPRAEDVRIEDIAHHLSLENRFTGATGVPYSVAQHCVLCSLIVPPQYALWGLLHDASEAYLKDLPRPIKYDPRYAAYREDEERLQRVISKAFGLAWPMPDVVKAADDILCQTERRDLLPPTPQWSLIGVEPLKHRIVPWSWQEAKQQFLGRYETLASPGFAWLTSIGLMPRRSFALN